MVVTASAEAPEDAASPQASEPIEGPEEVVSAPDPGPVDHRDGVCFADAPAPALVLQTEREGALEVTHRASLPLDRDGRLHALPGSVVRVEVTLENVGEAALTISETAFASMRSVRTAGGPMPTTSPSALAPGQRIEPGAMLRLCVELDVGDAPLTVSSGSDAVREYPLSFPAVVLETGHPLYHLGATVIARYRIPSGRRRESDSWGGVIAVRPAPGASLLAIARETGIQLGSRVPLFVGRESAERPDDEVLFEAPVHMRVRDAVATLGARADVVSAAPILQGEAGTEGCSDNSPCRPGLVCGYPCGIDGCPNACMTRAASRIRRP